MKKILYLAIPVILITLYQGTDILAIERKDPKGPARYETEINFPARASPEDTTQYSIQMEGPKNTLIVNGKVMVSTPDTTEKENTIRVRGEGNTITINQTDRKSEVNVSQKGKKNRITISQNNSVK